MKKPQVLVIAFMLSTFTSVKAQAKNLIDRYTILSDIETSVQAKPLNVVVSAKFAKNIITVKQTIEHLLKRSGLRQY